MHSLLWSLSGPRHSDPMWGSEAGVRRNLEADANTGWHGCGGGGCKRKIDCGAVSVAGM